VALTTKELAEQEKIKKLMAKLGCTEEEALDVIRTDKLIDSGQRTPYDLSVKEEKEALRLAKVSERKAKETTANQRGKVRAENPTKSGIIANLAEFLTQMSNFECESVKITNKERQIAFKCGENDYELTLVQKRKPKK